MKNKLKKLLKNKAFIIFIILFIIFLGCLFLLRGVFFPGVGSNYGNRLDGIKKISFTKKDQNKIVDNLKKNDKVDSAKMNIHGKIINVIFNVNKDTPVDEAKKIAEGSLNDFSDKVKGFYDIQYIITKKDEKGEEVKTTSDDGKEKTEIKKEFPIMGYKNSNKDSIVW